MVAVLRRGGAELVLAGAYLAENTRIDDLQTRDWR